MSYKPIQKISDRRIIPYSHSIQNSDYQHATDLFQGMTGYYPLDGNGDDFLYNTNFSVIGAGVNYVAGKVGQCAIFDGVTATYLEKTFIAPFLNYPICFQDTNFAQSLSCSCWVTLSDITAARSAIAQQSGFRIGYINTTNNWRFSIGVINIDGGTPVLNDWTHLCLTYSPSNNVPENFRGYVNGVKIGVGIGSPIFGQPLQIGARIGVQLWAGKIDEIILYNKVLTDAQIQNLYKLGLAGKPVLSNRL